MSNSADLISIYNQSSDTNVILSRIKFIGRIQKGDKINVRYMSIQPDTWYTRIVRTIYCTENRQSAFDFINYTINLGFGIATQSHTHNSHIIEDLKNACNGLTNLCETYHDDIMFCCKLDTLVESITARLSQIQRPTKIEDEEYSE
jgi:hypothetical protein